jgi:hypothetical protein
MICAPTDKDRCASPTTGAVRPMKNICCEPLGPIQLKVRLVQEANVNVVVTEKVFHFQLPAANTISVPTSQPQGYSPVYPRPHSHMQLWIGWRFWGRLAGELPLLGGRRPWRGDGVSPLCRFSRRAVIPRSGHWLFGGGKCWVSLFGTGWLGFHHRHLTWSGLTLTARWGACLSVRRTVSDEVRVEVGVAWALTTQPARTWFQPGPNFFCSGDGSSAADLDAGRRMETPAFRPRSPCARFAVAILTSFHLLQPR